MEARAIIVWSIPTVDAGGSGVNPEVQINFMLGDGEMLSHPLGWGSYLFNSGSPAHIFSEISAVW